MSTDKFLQVANKAGFHKEIRVTPLNISADTRIELPPSGIEAQLHRRNTLMVQNTSSGTLWLGGDNVGYGPSFGGGDSSSCSGIRVEAGGAFLLDASRVRIYCYNPGASSINIKLLEVA